MNYGAGRRMLIILAAIIITLGVSGCMKKKPELQKQEQQKLEEVKPDPEVVKEQVLSYLQEKYGEEFVPMTFSDSNWAYSYKSMYLYPKNGTKADYFEVRGTKRSDGTYRFSDGYFGKYISQEYAEVVSGMIKEIYEDFKFSVSFGEGIFPDRLNKDTKIEEIYNKDENFNADIVIFVKEASAQGIDTYESLRKLAAKMIEKKLVGDIRIYIVHNDKFESINMDALNAVNEREYFLDDYKIIMIGINLEILKIR